MKISTHLRGFIRISYRVCLGVFRGEGIKIEEKHLGRRYFIGRWMWVKKRGKK